MGNENNSNKNNQNSSEKPSQDDLKEKTDKAKIDEVLKKVSFWRVKQFSGFLRNDHTLFRDNTACYY